MSELQPKITADEKWGNFSLQVDIDCPYIEDYQMKMLGHNDLQGILQVKGCGEGKKSRYMCRTQGMTRLSCRYETEEIGRDRIVSLLEEVMAAADELKRYLLDPDCLLLSPECIFEKDGRYWFCYIPVRVKPLCRSLHELTEFFLEKLDYRDTEGVFLACLLHKETMKEGYDLAEILRRYQADEAARLNAVETAETGRRQSADNEAGRRMAGQDADETARINANETAETGRRQSVDNEAGRRMAGQDADETTRVGASGGEAAKDEDLLIVDEEETGVRGYCASAGENSYASYAAARQPLIMHEEGKKYGPLKKLGRRLKTGYWGNWGDLITEAKDDVHQSA